MSCRVRSLLAICLGLALCLAPHAAPAATKTITRDYLPANGLYGMCDIEPVAPTTEGPLWPANIGAACIKVGKAIEAARIKSIVDIASDQVSFGWTWLNKDWYEVGSRAWYEDPTALLESGPNHGQGCATGSSLATGWLEKPAGARYFYVHVHDGGPNNCSAGGNGATAGTITFQTRT